MKKFTVCLLIGAMAASMLTAVEAMVEVLILQTKSRQQFRNNDYYDERF